MREKKMLVKFCKRKYLPRGRSGLTVRVTHALHTEFKPSLMYFSLIQAF